MTRQRPNHALQRTRPSRSGCNPRVPRAGPLKLGSLGASMNKFRIDNSWLRACFKNAELSTLTLLYKLFEYYRWNGCKRIQAIVIQQV